MAMASRRRQSQLKARAQKKASKEARMRSPGEKSRYQQKLSAKLGRGTISPDWMWWSDRTASAVKEAA